MTAQPNAHVRFHRATASKVMGHPNPAFTYKCYGRDPREEQAILADVLERMTKAANGG